MLVAGGMCASLFGTGADIILYTLLVTRFRMQEKVATHMSIMLMASISVLGYAYRHFVDQGLTGYQVQTWLCAYPVVLLMAPLGAYVLHRINKEIMLYAIAVLNVAQLLYFLCYNPSLDKLIWACVFTAVLSTGFYLDQPQTAAYHYRNDPVPKIVTSPQRKDIQSWSGWNFQFERK